MKVNNSFSKHHAMNGITAIHRCSVDSLLRILRSKKFKPAYDSPIAGDSGINCFIEGRTYQSGQCLSGDDVSLILIWEGPFKEVPNSEPFPLTPNILYNQERWRAIIPAGTNRENIIVAGFDATGTNIGFFKWLILNYFQVRLWFRPLTINISS